MWQSTSSAVTGGMRIELLEGNDALSFRRFFRLLEHDDAFRTWYTSLLVDTGYDAYFWEFPPLTEAALDDDVEFVLIESAALSRLVADPVPFRKRFEQSPSTAVVGFANLGRDAQLIVPAPLDDTLAYPHLGAFLRDAPAAQIHALWQQTARTVTDTVAGAPTWLSTAGLGVSWLHLRLDTRPKYYRYRPYATSWQNR